MFSLLFLAHIYIYIFVVINLFAVSMNLFIANGQRGAHVYINKRIASISQIKG